MLSLALFCMNYLLSHSTALKNNFQQSLNLFSFGMRIPLFTDADLHTSPTESVNKSTGENARTSKSHPSSSCEVTCARKGCRKQLKGTVALLGLGSLWESEISHRSPP